MRARSHIGGLTGFRVPEYQIIIVEIAVENTFSHISMGVTYATKSVDILNVVGETYIQHSQ